MITPTSGQWTIQNSNTPLGTPKVVAIDNPYLTKDEYITNELAIGLGITASSPIYTSGRIDKLLLTVSAQVNRLCRRWFDCQTIDETKTGIIVRPWNPQLVTVVLQNSPYSKINSIYFQVLKWFIQIDTSSNGYLQDWPDLGMYKIVPLLSNSGTGTGSPMPAEIVDKTPLGVLWTNYTFGYGTVQTGVTLSQPVGNSDLKTYQAPLYNRLFAPSQPLSVYLGSTLLTSSQYSINDYANGIIVLTTANFYSYAVTANYTSNESMPFEIKEAVSLLVSDYLGQAGSNPTGATSLSMQTFSASWDSAGTGLMKRAMELLKTQQSNMPIII